MNFGYIIVQSLKASRAVAVPERRSAIPQHASVCIVGKFGEFVHLALKTGGIVGP